MRNVDLNSDDRRTESCRTNSSLASMIVEQESMINRDCICKGLRICAFVVLFLLAFGYLTCFTMFYLYFATLVIGGALNDDNWAIFGLVIITFALPANCLVIFCYFVRRAAEKEKKNSMYSQI